MMEEDLLVANRLRMGSNMLMHRTMFEFGSFCEDLIDYYIYGVKRDSDTFEFFTEKKIRNRKDVDLDDPSVYSKLFREYWEWLTDANN